jgi:hypothetical protein
VATGDNVEEVEGIEVRRGYAFLGMLKRFPVPRKKNLVRRLWKVNKDEFAGGRQRLRSSFCGYRCYRVDARDGLRRVPSGERRVWSVAVSRDGRF